MKIVVLEAEALGKEISLQSFHKLGEVVVYERTEKAQVAMRVKDADIIVVNRLPMNESTLAEALSVKLICVTGTGVNIIDFAFCKKRQIAIRNVSNYCTHSVAQHTITLALYLTEKLWFYNEQVCSGKYREGVEQDYSPFAFHELASKTWGICGMGNIGRKVAELGRAFGCSIIYYSTSGQNHNAEYEEVSFQELLQRSDILSIHAPLNEKTVGLFDQNAFEQMKEESILLNLGRGAIIKEEDLLHALVENKIGAAGLDVLTEEPMKENNKLLSFQDKTRLIITPHIGWASIEARKRVVDAVYENIQKFIS